MATFFENSEWEKLKKVHDLDKPEFDKCMKPMNAALKTFHALEEKEINPKKVEAVADAIEPMRRCLTNQKAHLSILNMASQMSESAKKFLDALESVLKKHMNGYFKKAGWTNLKKEQFDSDDWSDCLGPIDKTLKLFHELEKDEIAPQNLVVVSDKLVLFERCVKSQKNVEPAATQAVKDMRDDIKKFREALSAAIKKGLA